MGVRMSKPILRWAGGKTGLLPEILSYLPKSIAHYSEPFLGGGAVFFALMADRRLGHARLNDANVDLVAFYNVMSGPIDDFVAMTDYVDDYRSASSTDDTYRGVRTNFNLPAVLHKPLRAAEFLFLNKNCFNGLYRVNQKGEYNVPWGKFKEIKLPSNEELMSLRKVLVGTGTPVHFDHVDFEEEMRHLKEGHVCYLDPPYLPLNGTSFTEYSQTGFTTHDHVRLANAFRGAAARGAKLLLSNSDTFLAHQLYDDFKIETVTAARSINSNGGGRGKVNELLISANLQ